MSESEFTELCAVAEEAMTHEVEFTEFICDIIIYLLQFCVQCGNVGLMR